MIVIVGGGYAGAATAWALARRGAGSRVTLLEAETTTGAHASGRNAGLIGPMLEEDETLVEMAARGARLLQGPIGPGGPPLIPCGSVRLVTEGPLMEAMLRRARDVGAAIETLRTRELARDIPLLAGATAPVALCCPTDGKVDPAGLLAAYLAAAREAGVRVVTGARVVGLTTDGDRVTGVRTTTGTLPADWVVNAAGAWAGQLAALAGIADPGLASYRRHLFFSAALKAIDPGWPWVWDLPHDVYYRVDGDRLMLCACDVEPHPAAAAEVSPAMAARLAEKLAAAMPAVGAVALESARACLRTFAPDRRYVIGPDPRLTGFFWVAGLGGTGATASAAAGELAAGLLMGENASPALARAFDPARPALARP